MGIYGIHGWVKLESYTAAPTDIFGYRPWYLRCNGSWRSLTPMQGRPQGRGLVAQIDGLDDRDQARSLTGCEILVDQSQLADLPDGEYYWRDLIGLRVLNTRQQELGQIKRLMETGAHDVLVVEGPGEILIPYTTQVVRKVDLENGTMTVDWEPDSEY